MTLDEAIRHAEEVANECTVYFQTSDNEVTKIPSQCAEEHRQLAEWLKELKALREQKRPHGEWIFTGRHNIYGGTEIECSNCHNKLMVSMSRWKVGEKFCDICGSQNKNSKDELNLDSYSWVETDEFINEIGADLNGW